MTGKDLRRTLDIHAIIARAYKDDRFHQSRLGVHCRTVQRHIARIRTAERSTP